MSANNTSLAYLHKYLPRFKAIMTAIPGNPEEPGSATQLVKTFSVAIIDKLQDKNPDQLVADHATDLVFEPNTEPSAQTMRRSWWDSSDPGRPQNLVRVLFPLALARELTPAGFQRANQGVLCQPSAETGYRPIEFIMREVGRAFCRANKMSSRDVMTDLVDIFTNTSPIDDDIDKLKFDFVYGMKMRVLKGNRIDLVHTIRILFFTGYLIYFTNPTAFKWAHPVFLIVALFQAQTNFFPPNKDMAQALSEGEKSKYLLALGLNVFEAIRKPFDAEFFKGPDLFPTSINPTNMPHLQALNFVPAAGAPPPQGAPAPPANHAPDEFNLTYFLFGNQVLEGTNDEGVTAELFDHDVLTNYTAVRDRTEDLPQVTGFELMTLMTIIIPKTHLRLNARKNYGYKNKQAMIDLINTHIATFDATYATYLGDLADTIQAA